MDEVHQTRETSTSAVSSNNHPAKREREEDKDEDMEITTSREDSIHNDIDKVAVVTNIVPPAEKDTEPVGYGDLEYNEGMITEFHVPETDQDETFTEQLAH